MNLSVNDRNNIEIISFYTLSEDQVSQNGKAFGYGLGRPGFDPGCLRGGDSSSLLRVQTGPGVHSASYKMNTGDFPRGKDGRA